MKRRRCPLIKKVCTKFDYMFSAITDRYKQTSKEGNKVNNA